MTIGKTGKYAVRPVTDIKDLLYSSVALYGDRNAFYEKNKVTDKYEAYTYKKFLEDSQYLGTALCKLGLKGKRIVVIGENRFLWCVSYMAVLNGVGAVVPVDVQLSEEDLNYIFDTSKPSAVIYTDKKEKEIKSLAGKIPSIEYFINMDGKEDEDARFLSMYTQLKIGKALIDEGNKTYLDAKIDPDETLIILYTSATTSVSKAVQLTHHNLASNLMAMNSMIHVEPDNIFLSNLPLHHTYECTCGFLCLIYLGCAIAYCEGLKYIVKNMSEIHPTVMISVPLLFEGIYKKIIKTAEKEGSLKKLNMGLKIADMFHFNLKMRRKLFKKIHDSLGGEIQMMLSGAAAISPDVSKFFRKIGMKFLQGYGLTECSPILCLNSDVDYEDASAGKVLPGVEIVILDKDTEGIGEICAKGPNIMKGYLDMPEENARVFEGGYFHTGDLGYINERDFVYITGRKKSVIITKSGKNVFPEELEVKISKNKYVEECLVFAVKAEDGEDIITASIFPSYSAFEEEFHTVDKKFIYNKFMELVKEINATVPTYKAIHKLIVRDVEFVKTTTKKVKRYGENMKV